MSGAVPQEFLHLWRPSKQGSRCDIYGVDCMVGVSKCGEVSCWYRSKWTQDRSICPVTFVQSNGNCQFKADKECGAVSAVCLFIDGVSEYWTRREIFEELVKYGEIVAMEFAVEFKPPQFGDDLVGRGFGYVQFKYPECAHQAVHWSDSTRCSRKLVMQQCRREFDLEKLIRTEYRELCKATGPRISPSGDSGPFRNNRGYWDFGVEQMQKKGR